MTKVKEYAAVYVSFWRNGDKWQLMASQTPPIPDVNSSVKYYKLAVPVPDHLLLDQLPNQEDIKLEPTN